MTAVRKIEMVDTRGRLRFVFDSTGLPERPVIMHTCACCGAASVITNKDAGDLAAWLIGEAVDDAHGRGVLYWSETPYLHEYHQPRPELTTCDVCGYGPHPYAGSDRGQTKPWTPSGPNDEAGTGPWPRKGRLSAEEGRRLAAEELKGTGLERPAGS